MFDEHYPTLTARIFDSGLLELGQSGYSRSVIRILDTGGMLRESEKSYETIGNALTDAEAALKRISEEL